MWSSDHETYGKTRDNEAKLTHPVTGLPFEPQLRFQGQYEDLETGLYQNRYRYYDPGVGRYISQDPIGLMGGLNAYRYCPNPVEFVDPLGLSSKECDSTSYLYRGVHSEHPALEDAKKGIVKPANPAANVSPEQHAEGGLTGISQYVSWTPDRELALQHASKSGRGGVLLSVPNGAPAPNDSWAWGWTHINEWGEVEMLQTGIRTGVEVIGVIK
ncbi:MAG: RHS repeat-associated core domain-containing protein [Saccharospirillum sp.]|nr:RHS repeat-associated core domain-containing protein [Saccharospirillum sp.]